MSEEMRCKKCHGEGKHRDKSTCKACNGSGRVTVTIDDNDIKHVKPAVRS